MHAYCRSGEEMQPPRWQDRALAAITETLWPTRCAGCGRVGELLCPECASRLPWIEQRSACPCCGAPYGSDVCTECHGDWPLATTICAMSFEGVAARIVRIYKDQHETRLAGLIAAAMATAVDEAGCCLLPTGEARCDLAAIDAICFMPSTPSALRRRGFDPMELVAKHLSNQLDLPLADVLAKDDVSDQRGLGREARWQNLAGSVSSVEDVSGMRLLLADDVVTTGASLAAAAEALSARGAQSVSACAFARVW